MDQRTLYEKPFTNFSDAKTDENSWEFHYNKIMLGLEGSKEEKEEVIRKRILRYFGEFKIESESYFSIRNDVDYNIPGLEIIASAIVLYGIDYMPIERAKSYFKGFTTNIRRMDDSHYLVEFRNFEDCLAAINKVKEKKFLFFLNPKDLIQKSNEGWIDLIPYHEFTFERKLMARYLTNVDRIDNIGISTKESFAYAYSQAKRRFIKTLKEDVDKNFKVKSIQDRGHRGHRRTQSQNMNSDEECGERISERLDSIERLRSRDKEFHNGSKWSSFKTSCNCSRRNKYEQEKHWCAQMVKCCSNNRSRSRSPSCSRESFRRQFEIPSELRESESNFERYIKKRNQKKTEICFNRILESTDFNSKVIKKDERSASTSIEDYDIEGREAKKKRDKLNETEMDFEQFLEKLKIDDSKNDYSAFDFEEEEGE